MMAAAPGLSPHNPWNATEYSSSGTKTLLNLALLNPHVLYKKQ